MEGVKSEGARTRHLDNNINVENFMSKSPQETLETLLRGNEEYVNGQLKPYVEKEEKELSSSPQAPTSVIVSCLDSRVPVERIFNQGVGDMFVARVAGNVMNDDIVGSLEFAVLANNVKLVVVLGHTKCGAVKGACNGVELGKLTQLLDKISPVVDEAKKDFDAAEGHDSDAFYNFVAERNAEHAVDALKQASPEIAALAEKGEVLLVSAIYDLDTQEVSLTQ